MAEPRCTACGMPRRAWRGGSGQGYPLDGDTFCCQGCAEGTGCTCGDAAVEGQAEEPASGPHTGDTITGRETEGPGIRGGEEIAGKEEISGHEIDALDEEIARRIREEQEDETNRRAA